nr:hypothetical protein CFP56_23808 [Quercus suber]
MSANFVPDSIPTAFQFPCKRQQLVSRLPMTRCSLPLAFGAWTILAECSLYATSSQNLATGERRDLDAASATTKTHSTVLTAPNEIGFAATTRLLVRFLSFTETSVQAAVRSVPSEPYKSAHGDPVRVRLATRCTLDLESIIEGVLLRVFRLEIRHAITGRVSCVGLMVMIPAKTSRLKGGHSSPHELCCQCYCEHL